MIHNLNFLGFFRMQKLPSSAAPRTKAAMCVLPPTQRICDIGAGPLLVLPWLPKSESSIHNACLRCQLPSLQPQSVLTANLANCGVSTFCHPVKRFVTSPHNLFWLCCYAYPIDSSARITFFLCFRCALFNYFFIY